MAVSSHRSPPSRPHRLQTQTDVDALNATIEIIYEAATDPSQWPGAVARLVKFVGSSGGQLGFIEDATDLKHPDLHLGMPPGTLVEYNMGNVKTCPCIQSARLLSTGSPCHDCHYTSEHDIDSDELSGRLQEMREAIRYCLASRLHTVDGSDAWLCLAFRWSEDRGQAGHMQRLRTMLPHLGRAIRVSQRLGTWELACAGTLAALNVIDVATFVLGRGGKVLHMNTIAETVVRSGTFIRLSAGRLLFMAHDAHRQVTTLIDSARLRGRSPAEPRGGSIELHAPNSTEAYRVSVSPLRMLSSSLAFAPTDVIVFVERVRGHVLDINSLRLHFDLTATEARLAALLAQGQSPTQAAAVLGVSLCTVRSHLKAILAKTGTHRQAALVGLLLSS